MEVVSLATALEDMQWVRPYYAEVFPGGGHARAGLLKTAAFEADPNMWTADWANDWAILRYRGGDIPHITRRLSDNFQIAENGILFLLVREKADIVGFPQVSIDTFDSLLDMFLVVPRGQRITPGIARVPGHPGCGDEGPQPG